MQKLKTKAPRLSVAPMMDWTDRHCRFFHRLIAPQAVLYTEMVTTGALIHGDQARHLDFNHEEHPLALQLGGSDPRDLAYAAKLGEKWGYDEINLNCGCPSDRVQKGRFGACLMKEPATVAEAVRAMKDAVFVPVTVKCRIGVDEQDDAPFLMQFAEAVHGAGADRLIVHARKAWLKGLSPKQNRTRPPLDYERVGKVKSLFPDWPVELNGGLTEAAQLKDLAAVFDGFMIGRAAYQNPAVLADMQAAVTGRAPYLERVQIAMAMAGYIDLQTAKGVPVQSVTRHMMGLFNGLPGARRWRRELGLMRETGKALRQLAHEISASEAVSAKETA